MSRSGKLSIALPRQQITQIKDIVEAGEYGSAAAVIREALRSFLHRRDLRAGGGARFARARRLEILPPEPAERVELLFDAGDAKA